jgi:hypothetical protein
LRAAGAGDSIAQPEISMRTLPAWLQGMVAPTLLLWMAALASACAWFAHDHGLELPRLADVAGRFAQQLTLAFWVGQDARKRRRVLWHDFEAFVFFAWPLVLPVYLWQTRGWRSLITVGCFVGIGAASMLLAWLLHA